MLKALIITLALAIVATAGTIAGQAASGELTINRAAKDHRESLLILQIPNTAGKSDRVATK